MALAFQQVARLKPQELPLEAFQVFPVTAGFGVYLIIFVFSPPLGEEGQAVDRAYSGWMTGCRSS